MRSPVLWILVASLCSFCVSAQTSPRVYLGFGTGLNCPAGALGASVEFQFVRNATIYGAFGLGSWGGKAGGGFRFYPSYPDKFAFSLSYSYASGINEVDLDMDDEYVVGGNDITSVTFKLLPVSTVNISVLKHWLVGPARRNRIGLEAGYAIPLARDRFESDEALTDDGKTFMNILQPGGFLLGTTFSFGL